MPVTISPGDLLQRLAGIYRNHVLLFAGILAIPSCVTAAAGSWVMTRLPGVGGAAGVAPDEAIALLGPLLGSFTLFWGVSLLVGTSALAATARAVDRVQRGEACGVAQAWTGVAVRGASVIGLAAILAFVTLAGPGAALVVGVIAGAALSTIHAALAAVAIPVIGAGVAVTAWAVVRISLSPAALILEGRDPRAAIGRSVALTRGHVLAVTVILLVLLMAQYVVIFVVQGPFLLIGRFFIEGGVAGAASWWWQAVQALAGACGNAFGGPFLMIGVSLLHRELGGAGHGGAGIIGDR